MYDEYLYSLKVKKLEDSFARHLNFLLVLGLDQNYIKYCGFFLRIFIVLRSLPRQHWAAAIGWKENGQPIGVTVH